MTFNVSENNPLSFVRKSELGTDFWAIESTGDYSDDCQRGRNAATEFEHNLFHGEIESPVLGSIVRAMIEKGNYCGLEAGFFQQLAEELSPVDLRARAAG